MKAVLPSPYLRDRVADMPAFRDRDRPLPMRPEARCSHVTVAQLPIAQRDPGSPSLPIFGAIPPIGSIGITFDDAIPEGIVEIDGTPVAMTDIVALCSPTVTP